MSLPSRKIKLRVSGEVPPALGVKGSPLPGAAPPRSIEDARAEVSRVVKRLVPIVTQHLASARRMGYPLTTTQVLAVLEALRAEAARKHPLPTFAGNEVAVYLQQTLYEELLAEPSNVFYSTRVGDDVMRYEPLPREFWLACLEALQTQLSKLGLPPAA